MLCIIYIISFVYIYSFILYSLYFIIIELYSFIEF
jgi:hypothetical protein